MVRCHFLSAMEKVASISETTICKLYNGEIASISETTSFTMEIIASVAEITTCMIMVFQIWQGREVLSKPYKNSYKICLSVNIQQL